MKIKLTYQDGEAQVEGDKLEEMSESFRLYVQDIASTYSMHMRSIARLGEPVGKLEIELELNGK